MSSMSLSFSTPEHGWLTVTLAAGERARTLVVSDTPSDSLRALADAALDVLTGSPEATVTWHLEPLTATWLLRRDGDRCELSVTSPERGGAREVFAEGPLDGIIAPIWRALRRLEADPAWSASTTKGSRMWAHPFPTREVTLLGEHVRGERGGE